MTTQKYTLKGDMPLLFDGVTYGEGDIVEMDEADAKYLVAAGRLEAAASKPAAPKATPPKK